MLDGTTHSNPCSEFHPSAYTGTLDKFVGDNGVVAWMPSSVSGTTGCVCIVLNLTSLRHE
jgi:hypothetical protein